MIPELATERLVLRAHTAADLDDCAALWGDPLVVRHLGGRPFSTEETWTKVLRYAGLWALCGYGYWVAIEKASGRFVGEVGFADFKRDIAPALDAPECGWALAPWAHGRGLATEAVRAALAWRGGRRTACMIAPDNLPSLRVAHKCGFVEYARTTYRDAPTILLARG